jgi:hypothetical protein
MQRSWMKNYKRATRCTEAPAYAGSGKGSHHLVYCTQPYPVFTQEAVSRKKKNNNYFMMKNYDPQKSIFQILVTSGFILPNIFMM